MKSKLAKSINISSNSTIPFAAALTNPTELAKAKGNLKHSYPVSFRDNPFRPANTTHKAEKFYEDKPAGVPFVSAEDAYQHFQVGLDNDQKFALIVEILEAKLTQYPQLTEIITKNGGAAWLNQCSHVVNNADSFWEGMGLNSGFITALITAYRKIANDTSSLCIVKSDPKEITEEPQDDSIIILDKYVSYEPTSLSLRISFNNKTKAQQWGKYLNKELFISDTFGIENSLKENWKYDLVVPTVSEYEATTLVEIINFGLPPSENNPNTEAQAA